MTQLPAQDVFAGLYIVFFLACVLVGLPFAIITKRWRAGLIMAALLIVGRVYFVLNPKPQPDVDFNVSVSAAELAGKWSDGLHTLEIQKDGQYSLDGRSIPGTVENWKGQLKGWRVIRGNGELRILMEWPGDPDSWDGKLGFQRISRAPTPVPAPGQ